jgi:chromosome partitioning protein
MLITPSRQNLNKIVVLNPKGGCGKTTLVTNLASYYAARGPMPAVMDCDPQGSTMRWIEKRPPSQPQIHGIAAYKKTMQATRSWQLRVPLETMNLIVDSPAGLTHENLREITRGASSILVPVLPSAIDIHAASRCIADLLLVAKIDRRDRKLAVVANRTRQNTRSFDKLMRFLDSLGIPIIGVLRDSQNFVRAAEEGIGVCEMQRHRVRKEMEQLDAVVRWLDEWEQRRRDFSASQRVAPVSPVPVFQISGAGSA